MEGVQDKNHFSIELVEEEGDLGTSMDSIPDAEPIDTSPLRRQYTEIKRRHPDMLLLFQIGDFFEAFDADAHTLARELGLTLTRKQFTKDDVRPLAGLPIRALEPHLTRLLRRGFKVALCEQMTPPGKGLVTREVTRIITPGTIMEPGMLEGRANNYLVAYVPATGRTPLQPLDAGIAVVDITTGEFRVTRLSLEAARIELQQLQPAELLLPGSVPHPPIELRAVSHISDEVLVTSTARQTLLEHFKSRTLDAFGCDKEPLCWRAAAAIVVYLKFTQPDALVHLSGLSTYSVDEVMQLDPQTVRNLELFEAWDQGGASAKGSLIGVLDACITPMGGRLLRRWLRHPLLDLTELQLRQTAVEWFFRRDALRTHLRGAFLEHMDLERTVGRIRRQLAVPLEVVQLARSLRAAGEIQQLLQRHGVPSSLVRGLELDGLTPPEALAHLLETALTDHPPSDFEQGGIIREGYSPELDGLRERLHSGRAFIVALETRERQRTGIKSLKVSFNRVFGYYFEISRANLRFVPPDYLRKQTLANAERFFTLELKEHESLIANARERIEELERGLFRQLCLEVGRHHAVLQALAQALSRLDVLAALADVAVRHGYVRPQLEHSERLEIVRGRHPMVERSVPFGSFVANDTHMSSKEVQIALITAPNMAGKSVYLRQVALICLMAQIGSFVPADSVKMGILERVFTRVGLHEYLAKGQSSFMLEMVETAHILHHVTSKCLVLLDEVGRGTATADGLAIARSVLEYLHHHPRARARVLFATHYHELTECEGTLPRVRNYHLAVEEKNGQVRWLHTLVPGRAEKSFGLYVASLAGMPHAVLKRAAQLIAEGPPESDRPGKVERHERGHERGHEGDAAADHTALRLMHALATTPVDELSPLEALTRLYELQRLAAGAERKRNF